jgi:hypothetical protein
VARRPEATASRERPELPVLLIDLAAGRQPAHGHLDAEVVALAREHRMAGLLWSWAGRSAGDSPAKSQLALYDLYTRAHLKRVWNVLEASVERLDAVGIEVASVKGVIAESRWYRRPGERPCSDVDLLLSPYQLSHAADAVAALQPDHPWLPHLNAMATSDQVQSVTLQVEGLEVDLHFDLLKLGMPSRQAHHLWESTQHHLLPHGGTVRVLDDTATLFHLLVHLNKDRFQRLLGYADVARVVSAQQVHWPELVRLANRDGIEVPVLRTLEVVLDYLALPWPDGVARPRGARSLVWSFLWRPGIRLRGREGRLRYRRRQDWIGLLARRRTLEAFAWWLRGLVPPSPTVRAHYGHIPGPYLWKLSRGRAEASVIHRRQVASLRRDSRTGR